MPPKEAPKDAPKPRFRVRRIVAASETDLERELDAAAGDGYLPSDHLALPALVLANGDLLIVFEHDDRTEALPPAEPGTEATS